MSKIHAQTLLKMVDMYGNLAFTTVLVATFILLYKIDFFRKISGWTPLLRAYEFNRLCTAIDGRRFCVFWLWAGHWAQYSPFQEFGHRHFAVRAPVLFL